MLLDKLIEVIKEDKIDQAIKVAQSEAYFQTKLYSGKNQKELTDKYRVNESSNQKDQRDRLHNSRTKHKVQEIDNTLNMLHIMDNANPDIIDENETVVNELRNYIFEHNLEKQAFEFVKHYNIVDANSFVVAGINELDEIEFNVINCNALIYSKFKNSNLQYAIFKNDVKKNEVRYTDYSLYANDQIINLRNIKGGSSEFDKVSINAETYSVEIIPTNINYCFQLGYIQNMLFQGKTFSSILSPAEMLFTSLVQQGSELDVIDATHGIIKQSRFAPKCDFSFADNEGNMSNCSNGYLYTNHMPTGKTCSSCKGTGLKSHNSSQDIIYYPLPNDMSDLKFKLSDLSHTEIISTEMLNYKKERIKELESQIITAVFNANLANKSDVTITATEKKIDLQGVYSTLKPLADHVTECFNWMMNVISDVKYQRPVTVVHGYSMNLTLEGIEELLAKRKMALDSFAPIDVIKSIDLAIIQKQHYDSPMAIKKAIIWDRLKPFGDKNQDQLTNLLASTPNDYKDKILFNFFDRIKKTIEIEIGNDFYDFDSTKQLEIVYAQVDLIRSEIVIDERITFE